MYRGFFVRLQTVFAFGRKIFERDGLASDVENWWETTLRGDSGMNKKEPRIQRNVRRCALLETGQ